MMEELLEIQRSLGRIEGAQQARYEADDRFREALLARLDARDTADTHLQVRVGKVEGKVNRVYWTASGIGLAIAALGQWAVSWLSGGTRPPHP